MSDECEAGSDQGAALDKSNEAEVEGVGGKFRRQIA
jgi:hypothetical protein